MEGTNGARIPPTLHDMEHTPKPAFLERKGDGRTENREGRRQTQIFTRSPDHRRVELCGVDVGDVERRADHQLSQERQRRDAQNGA